MTLYQRVAYIRPDGVDFVNPQSNGTPVPLGGGLFVTPRLIAYNTYAGPGLYDLQQQGVVALMAADSTSPYGNYSNAGYRVVLKADGTMDLMEFMEAMAYLTVYGERDESLSQNDKLLTAKARPLEMRCGPTTTFVRNCAPSNIQTRQVHMLNVTVPNYFDDGHVACEAMSNGKWRLFDIPTDVAFSDGTELMSLAEVVAAGVQNCSVVSLAQPRCAPSDYNRNPNWIQAFFEMQMRTPAMAQAWRQRIYEVPGIALANGGICWGIPDHLSSYTSYVTGYPGTGGLWTALPWDDWVAAYY